MLRCDHPGCACACHLPDRGLIINRCAFLGSQIVSLRVRIPELEKLARRTPAKTLLDEKKKVEAAKINLELCRAQLLQLEPEWELLKTQLAVW